MKKIMVLILVMLVGCALFAVDVTSGSAQFDITTKIEQFVGVKVLNSGTTIPNSLDKPWYDDLTSITNSPVTVSETGSTFNEVAKVAYCANTPFSLTVNVPHLSGTGVNTYTIGYSSKILGEDISSGTTNGVVVDEPSLTTGASVNGGEIKINVNKGEYDLAPADTYTATIVFNIASLQ